MTAPPRPFLKWAGGKRQLLSWLRIQTDARRIRGTYFEPFLGGGALFFSLRGDRPTHARRWALSDANERLIRTYQAVRDKPEDVIGLLQTYPHGRDHFENMRQIDIDTRSDVDVAAWMIYLNRTCFNGLYRVNRRGRFNVPFGGYANPTIYDAENLRACSAALRGVALCAQDFAEATLVARKGDFAYFDPPYVPLSATSSFTGYSADGFSDAEQVRLRDWILQLRSTGVRVLLSNSGAPRVREMYGEAFTLTEVAATRRINSMGSKRGPVVELLIS